MKLLELLLYLAMWGSIGSAIFTLFVIVVFRTGLVWKTRSEDYKFKKKIPIIGYIVMASIPVGIISLQILANYISLNPQTYSPDFITLFVMNYLLYLVLFLYDTLIVDLLVLGIWQPSFLKLPNPQDDNSSIKTHILISIPIGMILGGIITLISTFISYHYLY
ncbi:MAG: hypothetical protein ACXACU_03045 [Candidatus Hodarchaeales archaeon]